MKFASGWAQDPLTSVSCRAHPIHLSWYDWEGQEGRDGEKVWYQLGSLTYSISAENPYASVAGERHDAVQKL